MKKEKKANVVAKDLRSPKYRMRVVQTIKIYDRKEKYKQRLDV